MPPSRTFTDCTWLSVVLVSLPRVSMLFTFFFSQVFFCLFPTFLPSLLQQPSLSPLDLVLTYPLLLLPSLTNLNHASNSQIRFRCCQGHGKQDKTAMVGESGLYQAYTRRQDLLPIEYSQESLMSGFTIVAQRQGAPWRRTIAWTRERPRRISIREGYVRAREREQLGLCASTFISKETPSA